MKKKQIVRKLQLNKETLRNLSERDLQAAVGGLSKNCGDTVMTACGPCPTQTCSDGSCGTVTCC
ncbi:MAG: class I lanthipeptide [Acidobacteriota bacterium]